MGRRRRRSYGEVPGHAIRLHLEEGHSPAPVVRTIDSGARPFVKLLRTVESQGGDVETRQREVVRQLNVRSARTRPRGRVCCRRHGSRTPAGADAPSLCSSTLATGLGRSQPWLGVRRSSDVLPSPSHVRKAERDRLSKFMDCLIEPGAGRARGPRTTTQIVGRSDALDLGARTRQCNYSSTSPRPLSVGVESTVHTAGPGVPTS
jgi:hypothetical protein